ncbi:MAG: hypothetical protein C0404_12430 [Verrucomicrobia bacterium]|nr:hypothetical protein [Verrucomicrobiota bacterium]
MAECKFWSGTSDYHKTIDRILKYLTRRDSKSAIICFVKNKDMSNVLTQIETATKTHPCFVKALGKKQEGWFDFDFHLKGDNGMWVKLAVLCFHFPEGSTPIP